ncbi:MAG: MFS transporter [Azovibrio sp.]|uniref:MFS transporter n=1 Tax=Azovibrio sp. TaxID=1872673 RepID=UPI003C7347DB
MTSSALASPPRHDAAVITLIGAVHGVSHFFHLLLPPLFPWLMAEFDLSFTRIGLTMTLFFVVSGFGQAAAGFLVDRWGAARVLAGGITCFILAALLLATATGFPVLLLVGGLAGLGNAVFHPSDFTVLNRHVSTARLGHAFSVHGLSGNLGWALAPVFMTGIATLAGWRVAALAAALLAGLALALLLAFRRLLDDPPGHRPKAAPQGEHPLAFLTVLPVWMCFAFFFLTTTSFGAIQNYAPSILEHLYGLARPLAAGGLSACLLGGAGGIALGGFLAKSGEHDRIIALMLGCAALLALLLATGWPPAWSILAVMAGIGFFTGVAGPSRDLLVRRAAVGRFGEAAYGRIYGFVYSGLDAGLALAPLIFGAFMDGGQERQVLVGVALLQGLAIFTALGVGRYLPAQPGGQAASR